MDLCDLQNWVKSKKHMIHRVSLSASHVINIEPIISVRMHFLWVFGPPVSLRDQCLIQPIFLSLAFSPLHVLSAKVSAWSVDHFILHPLQTYPKAEVAHLHCTIYRSDTVLTSEPLVKADENMTFKGSMQVMTRNHPFICIFS